MPDGDIVLADVAREAANEHIDCLVALGAALNIPGMIAAGPSGVWSLT